jgi:hypothetical protein
VAETLLRCCKDGVVDLSFLPADGVIEVFTAAERPDLWDMGEPFRDVWPEYNRHGKHAPTYFGALYPQHAHTQVLLWDRALGRAVARGRTIPFRWDGSLDDLPHGIDALGLQAVEETGAPNAISALAAEVTADQQGRGLSRLVLKAMAAAAADAGLSPLVAPVRPTLKEHYPLIPIEEYADWVRSDGLPFDPWMRVHARLGAVVVRGEPESLEIDSPVIDWERWIGMELPADGEYVFPQGLAPLTVAGDRGIYFEPNVWMLHEI